MRIKISILLALLAVLLSACGSPLRSESTIIEIVNPLDGARFFLGDTVEIKSVLALPTGATSVALNINGAFFREDAFGNEFGTFSSFTGDLYQPWTFNTPGTFILYVTAIGGNGRVDSAPVTIFIESITATIPPPPASATATSTPLETSTETPIALTETPTLLPASTNTPIFVVRTSTPFALTNSAMSGFVYRDENGNGNVNPADKPLAGINVLLGTGICPSTGFRTTQTGINGKYTFSTLPAGHYCVAIDTTSLPSIGGVWLASLPNPKDVTLSENEILGGRNFMFQPIIH